MSELERITEATIGDGGMWVRFAVKGPLGAVNFTVSGFRDRSSVGQFGEELWTLTGTDVGYHAKTAQYDGQKPTKDACSLTGGECFYDGTSTWASDHWWPNAKRFGMEWVWSSLEDLYRERLSGEQP